jgi:hypothetical protein
MKKITIISILLAVFIGSFVVNFEGTSGRTKAYYSGDAINFNGQIIVGSTNMKGMELFRLEDDKLVRKIKTHSFRARYGGFDDYNGLVFNIEAGRLFAYAIDGTYLYKYDISDLKNPILVGQVKDNSWDWFGGITKINDRIVTIGTKGIKMWRYDLIVLDSYKLKIKNFSAQFTANGQYIIYSDNEDLKVFDTSTRTFLNDIAITSNLDHARYFFNDQYLYFADDSKVKKTGLNGDVFKSFKHISDEGYDVAGLQNSPYIYFTDGVGVVKLTKEELSPVKWAYTTDLGEPNGWAMNLKVVENGGKETVIIFNNSSILALNDRLKYLSHYTATEEDDSKVGQLFLNLDKNHAAANSTVSLRGGGFAPNENLEVMFGKERYLYSADTEGQFTKILTVPDLKRTAVDIKVTGAISKQSYSIGFNIE